MKKIYERDMHNITTQQSGLETLKLPIGHNKQYSHYDASNKKYIVEYKARRKFFRTTQIEEFKLDKLIDIATKQGRKQVLYVVYDGVDSIHYFNLTNLLAEDYDFKWTTRKCPWTSEFPEQGSNGMMIDKRVGEICWTKAMHKVKVGE